MRFNALEKVDDMGYVVCKILHSVLMGAITHVTY